MDKADVSVSGSLNRTVVRLKSKNTRLQLKYTFILLDKEIERCY